MKSLVEAEKTAEENAIAIYSGNKLEEILSAIEDESRSVVFDPEKASDRKAAKSLAYKIARSKTKLDEAGKALVADWKAKASAVDASRKGMRDRLDALRDEVKAPAIEWEEVQARIEEEKAIHAEIEEAHKKALIENEIFDKEKELEQEAERLRLEREAIKEAERKKKEEDARILREKEIAERAREEAKREAEEKAERERQAVIKQQIEAERKAQMEIDRVRREAEEKAERERKERERKAAEEALKAQKEREAAERKAADVEHRRSVNNAAMSAMIESGIDKDCAKQVIILAASGKIPGMSVNY